LAKEFRVGQRLRHAILGEDGVEGGVVNNLVAGVPGIKYFGILCIRLDFRV
jgi:hypothetical protein